MTNLLLFLATATVTGSTTNTTSVGSVTKTDTVSIVAFNHPAAPPLHWFTLVLLSHDLLWPTC